MAERINWCKLRAENSANFWRGGWQLQASFSQAFLLQFWKSQCLSDSKYPEFFKTPPAFAFWMSLKVVMAVFPQNTIFFWTPCRYIKMFAIEAELNESSQNYCYFHCYCHQWQDIKIKTINTAEWGWVDFRAVNHLDIYQLRLRVAKIDLVTETVLPWLVEWTLVSSSSLV